MAQAMTGDALGVPFARGFEIHGVRVAVGASDREVLDRIVALLPPGLPQCDPETADQRFALLSVSENTWHYTSPKGPRPMYTDLSLVIGMLESELRKLVAAQAPDRVFVHAGAVAHRGGAIVVPGDSFSGKTTLVAALVRAGAEYYSDEYAVLDELGRVHPYAKPLSIRRPHPERASSQPVASLGGKAGVEPVPVNVIAATPFRPGASFQPEPRSAAKGMLALLAHAAPARERAESTLAILRSAASSALVLEGDRGEAEEAAGALLKLAEQRAANGASPGR